MSEVLNTAMDSKFLAATIEANKKIRDSRAHYKSYMFGYHAAYLVKYNALLSKWNRQPNYFNRAVPQLGEIVRGSERTDA
jgi:hypothetical protein